MNIKKENTFNFSSREITEARADRGFTLVDLLVMLEVLGVLAATLLPAFASSQPRGKAAQCLNSMRQLTLAWTLYASENNEQLAINSDPHTKGSAFFPAGSTNPSWITGTVDWTLSQANTNVNYLISNNYSLLGNYLGRSAAVFACPAANIVSPAQRSLGWNHRIRSVAMDAAVGNGDKYMEPGNPFGWTAWYFARKSTDLNQPGPGQTWVLIDEHPDSIDDGLMYTSSYATTSFSELPSDLHDGAGAVTFADGHVEMHKWTGTVANKPVKFTELQQIPNTFADPDMSWLAQHTPRR